MTRVVPQPSPLDDPEAFDFAEEADDHFFEPGDSVQEASSPCGPPTAAVVFLREDAPVSRGGPVLPSDHVTQAMMLLSAEQLRDRCQKRGLPISGSKSDLVLRLRSFHGISGSYANT